MLEVEIAVEEAEADRRVLQDALEQVGHALALAAAHQGEPCQETDGGERGGERHEGQERRAHGLGLREAAQLGGRPVLDLPRRLAHRIHDALALSGLDQGEGGLLAAGPARGDDAGGVSFSAAITPRRRSRTPRSG